MALHWRNLVILLPVIKEDATLLACIKAIVEVVHLSEIPDFFHDLVTVHLLSCTEDKARNNLAVALREYCAHYHQVFRELLSRSASDGDIMLFANFDHQHLLAITSGKSPLLCGKAFVDLQDSDCQIYKKSWVKKQKRQFYRILKSSSDSAEASLAVDMLGDETMNNPDIVSALDSLGSGDNAVMVHSSATERSSSADPDLTEETWLARLVRFLVSELIGPVADRRENAAVGLHGILSGLSSSGSESLSRFLPSFLLNDIVCTGVTALVLDQVVDFHDLQTHVDDNNEGTILPVKSALAALVVQAVTALRGSGPQVLLRIAADLSNPRHSWTVSYAGLLLWKDLLRSDATGSLEDAGQSVLGVLLSFAPVELSALAVQVLRSMLRSPTHPPHVLSAIVSRIAGLVVGEVLEEAELLECVSICSLGLQALLSVNSSMGVEWVQAVLHNVVCSVEALSQRPGGLVLDRVSRLEDLLGGVRALSILGSSREAKVCTQRLSALLLASQGCSPDASWAISRAALWRQLGCELGQLLSSTEQLLDCVAPDCPTPTTRINMVGAEGHWFWAGLLETTDRKLLSGAVDQRLGRLVLHAGSSSLRSVVPAHKPKFRIVLNGKPMARTDIGQLQESSTHNAILNALALGLEAEVEWSAYQSLEARLSLSPLAKGAVRVLCAAAVGPVASALQAVFAASSLPDDKSQQRVLQLVLPSVTRCLAREVTEEDVSTSVAVFSALRARRSQDRCTFEAIGRAVAYQLLAKQGGGFVKRAAAHRCASCDIHAKLLLLSFALNDPAAAQGGWSELLTDLVLHDVMKSMQSQEVDCAVAVAVVRGLVQVAGARALQAMSVATFEQLFGHRSQQVERASLARAVTMLATTLRDSIALHAYGHWIRVAVHGLGDHDQQVRSSSTQSFRCLVPLAPMAIQQHCSEALYEESHTLLRLLALKASSPSLLSSTDPCDQFVVKAAQFECATELRAYQWQGVSWWTYLRRCGLAGMLADEMGLGKTLQALMCIAVVHLEAAFARLLATKQSLGVSSLAPPLPALVVVPASLAPQWEAEVRAHFPRGLLTPSLCTSPSQVSEGGLANVFIVTYDCLRRQAQGFTQLAWEVIILDEAHLVKNPSTATAQAVFALKAKARLALTGTPVQNQVEDVWSLMNFLIPDYLGDHATFRKTFERPIRRMLAALPSIRQPRAQKQLELTGDGVALLQSLHKQVLPFLLRRTKEVVARDLPPKTVIDVLCPLSSVQKAMYDEFVSQGVFKGARPEDAMQRARGGVDAHQVASDEEDEAAFVSLHENVTQPVGRRRRLGAVSDDDGPVSAAGSLVALGYLGLVCVHPALVVAQSHKKYREKLLTDLKSSGKVLQLLRLVLDLRLVQDAEVSDAAVSSLAGRGVSLRDFVTSAVEELSAGQPQEPCQAATAESEEGSCGSDGEVADRPKRTKRRKVAKAAEAERTALPRASKKCLIFAQHRCALDLVEQLFHRLLPGVGYARLDGSVSPERRYELVQRFNRCDADVSVGASAPVIEEEEGAQRLFQELRGAVPRWATGGGAESAGELRFLLLTTRACSLGLNLTAADTVIFLEHDWNPFVDLQAMDRVHRIGQTSPVTIFRLLADSTLESRVMGLQCFKQQLAHQVLHGDGATGADGQGSGLGTSLWNSLMTKEQLP